MSKASYYMTIAELAACGRDNIPSEFQTDTHLIYNSPAALDFNSPGAQGFGVKRAGLSIPGSIMLLLAPGCCGRNTSAVRAASHYGDRFAYLMLDENDIVTGKHLNKVAEAVKAFVASRKTKPTCVMICITCVDALLGTDMERVCRKASLACKLPVLPSYMYALTRDSRKPPMTAIRKTIYSLLEPTKKDSHTANLLGYFAPLMPTELYDLLKSVGVTKIQEIGRTKSYAEYQALAAANFNLVLNPEAREAADYFASTLNIPSIELKRLYQLDKVTSQYNSLAKILGISFATEAHKTASQAAITDFMNKYSNIRLGIGSRLNANAFELALAMVRYGLSVAEIYATPQAQDFFYINRLAKLSPQTKLYTNLSPSMLNYKNSESSVTFALGADAHYYHPDLPFVEWNDEMQPFGYQGIRDLFKRMQKTLDQATEDMS